MPQLQALCLKCGYLDKLGTDRVCPSCFIALVCVTYHDGPCPECYRNRPGLLSAETYEVDDEYVGRYVFDVEKAKLLQGQGKLIEVPEPMLLNMLQVNVTEPQHYDHVDMTKPGIIGTVQIGEKFQTVCLLDGSHRAAQAVRLRQTFRVWAMSWDLVKQCILIYEPGTVLQEFNHGRLG